MKRLVYLFLILPIPMLAGCDGTMMAMNAPRTAPAPAPAPERGTAPYQPRVAVQPEPGAEPDSAVDRALLYADKYMQESERCEKLRGEIRTLEDQRQADRKTIDTLRAELAAAQQELDQANAMIREINTELKQWKQDVLGFRNDMLAAQEAQLRGINMILKVVGYSAPKTTAALPGAQPPAQDPAGDSQAPSNTLDGADDEETE